MGGAAEPHISGVGTGGESGLICDQPTQRDWLTQAMAMRYGLDPEPSLCGADPQRVKSPHLSGAVSLSKKS